MEEIGLLEADLSTSYAGLSLKNPVIAGSAGITETAERMLRAEDAGAGAVVVKSLFEWEVTRKAPTPRFRILKESTGISRSYVLYSYEQASVFDEQRYAEEIRRAKERLSIPVISSIACVTDEGWSRYAGLMEEAGADATELNLSCPHGAHIVVQRPVVEDMIHAIQVVKAATKRLPVFVKMTGQLTDPKSVALALQEAGADGVVMFNRFTGLDIDLETEQPILHGAYAGHGGPWAIHYPLRWISAVSPSLKIPISATSGVWKGEDVVKYLLAGATTVQCCSAIVTEGYPVIGRIVSGLAEFMERKGYRRIEDFRGAVCSRILGTEQVDRRSRFQARIDSEKCNACGRCNAVCIYEAIRGTGTEKRFVAESCDGCGLCPEVCPTGAIGMKATGAAGV